MTHLLYHRHVRPSTPGHSCGISVSLPNSHVFYWPLQVKNMRCQKELILCVCHQWVTKLGGGSHLPIGDRRIICSFHLFPCMSHALVCYIIFLFYLWDVLQVASMLCVFNASYEFCPCVTSYLLTCSLYLPHSMSFVYTT